MIDHLQGINFIKIYFVGIEQNLCIALHIFYSNISHMISDFPDAIYFLGKLFECVKSNHELDNLH
jgi:hypothetical protein